MVKDDTKTASVCEGRFGDLFEQGGGIRTEWSTPNIREVNAKENKIINWFLEKYMDQKSICQ